MGYRDERDQHRRGQERDVPEWIFHNARNIKLVNRGVNHNEPKRKFPDAMRQTDRALLPLEESPTISSDIALETTAGILYLRG
jgi:hypothetical protein